MKDLITRKKEAEERANEYSKLTSKQKYLKLDLKLGDFVGAKKQRRKLELEILQEPLTGAIPAGIGDSIQKPGKKPYQKPKRS